MSLENPGSFEPHLPRQEEGETFEDKINDLLRKARQESRSEPLLEKISLGFVGESEFDQVGQVVNEYGASERSFLGVSEEDAEKIFKKIRRYVLNKELRGDLKAKKALQGEILRDLEAASK